MQLFYSDYCFLLMCLLYYFRNYVYRFYHLYMRLILQFILNVLNILFRNIDKCTNNRCMTSDNLTQKLNYYDFANLI